MYATCLCEGLAHLHSPFAGPLGFRKQEILNWPLSLKLPLQLHSSSNKIAQVVMQQISDIFDLCEAGFHGLGDTVSIQGAVCPVFFSRHLCRCHTIHIRSNGQPVVLADGDNAFSSDRQFHMVTSGLEIQLKITSFLCFIFCWQHHSSLDL